MRKGSRRLIDKAPLDTAIYKLEKAEKQIKELQEEIKKYQWRDIDSAPYDTRVLAWLYLPKNPPASAEVIARRIFCLEDEPEDYGEHRLTVGCWFANGKYYTQGHIKHWMPLPKLPNTDQQGE